MSYFTKHWYGQQSLAIAYWVNAILVTIALHALGVVLLKIAPIADPIALSRVALFIILVALAVVVPWQFVGLWRAASNHIRNTGRVFWAKLARAHIALGLMSSLLILAYLWPLL